MNKMTQYTPWMRTIYSDDKECTIAILPPMLKALMLWSGKDYVAIEIKDKALYVYPVSVGEISEAKSMQTLSFATGEMTDRDKPLEFRHTFNTVKVAKMYEPWLDLKEFKAKDFCSCRRKNERTMTDRPYCAIKFDGKYSKYEIGRCVHK